jgi:hypothetical protein
MLGRQMRQRGPAFVTLSRPRRPPPPTLGRKQKMGAFGRLRLRDLAGARDEFHLAAIVQNLKTLAKHIWQPMLHESAACVT